VEDIAGAPAVVAGNVADEEKVHIQEAEQRIVVVVADVVDSFATPAAFVAHSSDSSVADAWYPGDAVAVAVVVQDDVARVAGAVA
jgi:hypothetical protein